MPHDGLGFHSDNVALRKRATRAPCGCHMAWKDKVVEFSNDTLRIMNFYP